ncbi:hypothetical protein KY331_04285 [Candidatus Woesearchaeota archaeon]|nr:hypothetical protein [Candidatus Woesearchaeota archaeon]
MSENKLNLYKRRVMDQAMVENMKKRLFGRSLGIGFGEFYGSGHDLGIEVFNQEQEFDPVKRQGLISMYQNTIDNYGYQMKNIGKIQLE